MECRVCGERLGASVDTADVMVMGCGHAFCWPCLRRWLRNRDQSTCPACRTSLVDLVMDESNYGPQAALICVAYRLLQLNNYLREPAEQSTQPALIVQAASEASRPHHACGAASRHHELQHQLAAHVSCGCCQHADPLDPVILKSCGHIFCWPCLFHHLFQPLRDEHTAATGQQAQRQIRTTCPVLNCPRKDIPWPAIGNIIPVYSTSNEQAAPARAAAAVVLPSRSEFLSAGQNCSATLASSPPPMTHDDDLQANVPLADVEEINDGYANFAEYGDDLVECVRREFRFLLLD